VARRESAKTALLDFVVGRTAGCQVRRAAGVESEMELAFAGLHQLCGPDLDRLDDLRRVFTKLGISTRRQLRRSLPDSGRTATSI
jgi:hypothetical protein